VKSPDSWTPPVLRAVAAKGEGITEIQNALEKHFAYLEDSGELRNRRRQRIVERVVEVAERRMHRRLWNDPATMEWLEKRVDELESGAITPYTVADQLLGTYGDLVKGATK